MKAGRPKGSKSKIKMDSNRRICPGKVFKNRPFINRQLNGIYLKGEA